MQGRQIRKEEIIHIFQIGFTDLAEICHINSVEQIFFLLVLDLESEMT